MDCKMQMLMQMKRRQSTHWERSSSIGWSWKSFVHMRMGKYHSYEADSKNGENQLQLKSFGRGMSWTEIYSKAGGCV